MAGSENESLLLICADMIIILPIITETENTERDRFGDALEDIILLKSTSIDRFFYNSCLLNGIILLV